MKWRVNWRLKGVDSPHVGVISPTASLGVRSEKRSPSSVVTSNSGPRRSYSTWGREYSTLSQLREGNGALGSTWGEYLEYSQPRRPTTRGKRSVYDALSVMLKCKEGRVYLAVQGVQDGRLSGGVVAHLLQNK
eukprot:9495459-Pyramimonas_sp.AAC.1